MLFEILLLPFWLLLDVIISLLPVFSQTIGIDPQAFQLFMDNLSYALYFFDPKFFCILITNILFWLNADFIWSIVVWIYKKIPGVQ